MAEVELTVSGDWTPVAAVMGQVVLSLTLLAIPDNGDRSGVGFTMPAGMGRVLSAILDDGDRSGIGFTMPAVGTASTLSNDFAFGFVSSFSARAVLILPSRGWQDISGEADPPDVLQSFAVFNLNLSRAFFAV